LQRGFALLEVLISGAITSIVIVGLALMFSYGQAFVRAAGDERVALYLAQKRMDEMRSIGLSQAIEEPTTPIPGFPEFVRTTTITGGTDLDGSGLTPRTITVSVRSLVREAGPISVTAAVFPH
jgi:Tfp pilus assembly protein PilV